jgi:hypothetical protein
MKRKMRHLMIVTFILAVSCQGSKEDKEPAGEIIRKDIVLCPDSTCQTIDGFDVNITPAQWREGKLKPVIYKLVDDLGSTLIRFDCHGTADWLDPAHRYALWKNLFNNIEMSGFCPIPVKILPLSECHLLKRKWNWQSISMNWMAGYPANQ